MMSGFSYFGEGGFHPYLATTLTNSWIHVASCNELTFADLEQIGSMKK